MLKTFRNRVTVKRGEPGKSAKITTGIPTTEGRGKAVDYFVVDDFPELLAAYGHKPQMLIVYPPSDVLEDFFDDQMCLWGGGKNGVKVRTCDTVDCVHRVAEEVEGVKYAAGEETLCICLERWREKVDPVTGNPEKDPITNLPVMELEYPGLPEKHPKKCRYLVNPKFYIGIPPKFSVESLSCYLFETHSINSGEQLKSELLRIQKITGRMAEVPFKLTVKMAGHGTDASKKFPIWHLEVAMNSTQLRAARNLQDGFDPKLLPETAIDPQAVMPVAELTEGPGATDPADPVGYTPEQISEVLGRYMKEMDHLEAEFAAGRKKRNMVGDYKVKINAFMEVAGIQETSIAADVIRALKQRWLALDRILKLEEMEG